MRKLRFLLAEQNLEHVNSVEQYLKEGFDCTLKVVKEKEDFIAALQGFEPDVILSNHYFSGFDGMQLLSWRNQILPNIPFIIYTENIDDELALNAIREGASDYIGVKHFIRLNFKIKKAIEQESLRKERDLAEKRLMISHERFQQFVEHDISGDYMEENGEVLYCNQTLLKMFEFDSLEELNAFKPVNLYKDPLQQEEVIKMLRAGKKVENKELHMHTRSGRPLTILENAFAELDADGNILRVQGYLIDITELKNAEASLIESETLFRTLMESTVAGMFIYDDANFLYVNSAVCAMLEYTEEELYKIPYWKVVHPDYRDVVKLRGQKRVNGDKTELNYQFKVITKSGKSKWVDFTAGPLMYQNKPAAIGTVYDITEMKEAKDEVKKLSIIIEQSPLSVLITDVDGNIEYVNRSFTEITGYSLKEVIGKNPRILKSGKTPKNDYKELWQTLTSGKGWRGEFHNRKKSGEEFIEQAVIAPVFDDNGNIIHYSAIKRDITLEKEIQNQLKAEKLKVEEANRLKTAILTNMSHELRTPLNGILGFSTLISDLDDLNEVKEMVGYINESGQRLLRTLNLIIDVSRLEAGNFKPSYEAVDLIRLLNGLVDKYQETASQKDIDLNFEPDAKSWAVVTDLKFVTDTIENLVDNAIKFTNEGTVTLTVGKKNKNGILYNVVTVADTGIGISKENQKLIFEDFQQESVGYGRVYEGTGLGLSIGRKYMGLLGGYIDLKSEVGKGSSFSVFIPETNIN